ncbi:uncharacterized protein LOC104557339 isoform X3 [Colius striatus]|uniref:uncharacterized protein LOC104557339 isoform X3 n=1 Tax=Colius striatus TaxID=57412 RepID=UPI002B1E2BB3|nr:uncharacterized protein LOC104557339 isoform X3 [Colius striatus]
MEAAVRSSQLSQLLSVPHTLPLFQHGVYPMGDSSSGAALVTPGSPTGSQVLLANLFQPGLFCPQGHRSCQELFQCGICTESLSPLGNPLLWCEVLPGLQDFKMTGREFFELGTPQDRLFMDRLKRMEVIQKMFNELPKADQTKLLAKQTAGSNPGPPHTGTSVNTDRTSLQPIQACVA